MKKDNENMIDDKDLDKVSGGTGQQNQVSMDFDHYVDPYICKTCGMPVNEKANIKEGDHCPYCGDPVKIDDDEPIPSPRTL